MPETCGSEHSDNSRRRQQTESFRMQIYLFLFWPASLLSILVLALSSFIFYILHSIEQNMEKQFDLLASATS